MKTVRTRAARSAFRDTPSKPSPYAAGDQQRTVLLAVTGQAPAILTETVWKLAHERPRCIPNQVVVVTTTVGRECFERELLAPSAQFGGESCWHALRSSLTKEFPEAADRLILDDFKVLTAPDPNSGRMRQLDDIRTRADNDAAANFILDQVRTVVGNPDCRLVASIAGGRKTMVALLYGCMSLLGRSQDRLTHVLVSQPFDDPGLTPRFYFPPEKPRVHELRDRTGSLSKHSSAAARIELCTVPFVCLRNLFVRELRRPAGDFTSLVNRYADRISVLTGPPEVRIDCAASTIVVNGTTVKVPTRELGLFTFLFERCRHGKRPYDRVPEAVEDLKAFLVEWESSLPSGSAMREEAELWRTQGGVFEGELNRKVSLLRGRFVDAGLTDALDFLLPKKKAFGINVRTAAPTNQVGKA